jgi:hypothetical protein
MNDFYLAEIPEPVTLLGLRLRPFSLGHKLLLHRVESAFVSGGQVTYDDLALSIFLCAQTFREGIASFSDPDLPRFMARWHRKLTGDAWWRRILRLTVQPVELKEKSEAFARYIEDGSRIPYYDVPADRIGSSEIETVHAVQLTLMAKTTLTEAELLDRPWGRCLFDYVALQAMEDKCTIRDKSAIDDARDVANRIAAKLNQRRNGAIQPDS